MAQTPESITAASLNILRRFIFADSMVPTTDRTPQMRAVDALGQQISCRFASRQQISICIQKAGFVISARLHLALLLAQRRANCTSCNLGRRKV
jgi:hypothetical protein